MHGPGKVKWKMQHGFYPVNFLKAFLYFVHPTEKYQVSPCFIRSNIKEFSFSINILFWEKSNFTLLSDLFTVNIMF